MPQKSTFRTAIGVRTVREALIVEIVSKDGLIGYGECSCRPDPFYSHEFVDGAAALIQKFIAPQLANGSSYQDLLNINGRIRGWHFAKSAVEFSFNDNLRRRTGTGLIEHVNMPSVDQVPVGISLGLFDDADTLISKASEAINEGYKRIKFKISPTYSDPSVLAAIAELRFDNISLDANGSFDMGDFALLNTFASMGYMIEQPFAPGDQYLMKEYDEGGYAPIKLCLDEEIESLGVLKSYKDPLAEDNIKPGRVGGLLATLNMIQYCKAANISAWIGGMFETGIGRALNLQVASLLVDAKAHDQSPSNRYFKQDVLKQQIVLTDGLIQRSAFGDVEVDTDVLDNLTTSLETFKYE